MVTQAFTQSVADNLVRRLNDSGVDGEKYKELTKVIFTHPLAEKLREMNPYSESYGKIAKELYFDIIGGGEKI